MTAATLATKAAGDFAAQTVPEWVEAYCARYAFFALDMAWWFLYLALAIGVLGAVLSFVNAIQNPAPKKDGEEGGGGGFAVLAEAVTALVEVFSKAPAWIAMLGAGLILLWFAGDGLPDYCVPPGVEEVQSEKPESSKRSESGAEPAAAGAAGTADDESGD